MRDSSAFGGQVLVRAQPVYFASKVVTELFDQLSVADAEFVHPFSALSKQLIG